MMEKRMNRNKNKYEIERRIELRNKHSYLNMVSFPSMWKKEHKSKRSHNNKSFFLFHFF